MTYCSIDPGKAAHKIAKGEMISKAEAKGRVVIGVVLLFLHVAINYSNKEYDSKAWSGLGFVLGSYGVMLYRMGRDSQCGCILFGAWNPEGRGFLEIPHEHLSFYHMKVRQLWRNIGFSGAVGIILQTLQLHFWNGHDLMDPKDLTDMALLFAAATAFTVIVSLPTKLMMVKTKPSSSTSKSE